MSKIHPFVWYKEGAEQAAALYVSVFKNSKIVSEMPGQGGTPMAVIVDIDGQKLTLFNGGSHTELNDSLSMWVDCKDQAEVDEYWEKLTADGGRPVECGWLVDKFGLRWQIVPEALTKAITDPDPARAQRAMQAMLKMQKIIVADIEAALEG